MINQESFFFRKQFEIIYFLAENEKQVFDKEQIYEVIWGMALIVMFLSYWRKKFKQTILIGAIIFVVPIALYVQGIEFTKYLSVYPLYSLFGK